MAEKVTGVNVEGRNYEFLAGQAVRGACTALATDWAKPVTLPEGTLLVDGLIVAVMFVNGTSVGWSGTKTVYSSDGENFFYDQAMTDPVTLPQPECYEIDHVQDNEYLLSCFPVVVYGTHRLPVCDSRGHYAGGALWAAGDTVAALYLDEKFMLLYSVVDEVKLGVPSPASSNAVARDAVLKSEITDEVAINNMYSVSSNAVALALQGKAPANAGVSLYYLTPRHLNTASSFTSWVEGLRNQGITFAVFSVGWEEYQSFPYAGAIGYVMIGGSSARAYGQLRGYADANFNRAFYWIDSIETNRYSGIVAI